ncbi:MAG: hypothetical protein GF308_20640 [Candidatus Heimdallarchaeota archaeon]|nr:hypothetical protein [Candidatus Heimdallarchaeota archaeon]
MTEKTFYEQSSTSTSPLRILSEQEIAEVLLPHLRSLGYQPITEFVLSDHFFDIKRLTGKQISKVRIDVAALKGETITFIEIENGLWVTHPRLYTNLAHRVILAFPAEKQAPTDQEQIHFAKKEGIGIVKVSSIGSVIPILPPTNRVIDPAISKAVKKLLEKRFSSEK